VILQSFVFHAATRIGVSGSPFPLARSIMIVAQLLGHWHTRCHWQFPNWSQSRAGLQDVVPIGETIGISTGGTQGVTTGRTVGGQTGGTLSERLHKGRICPLIHW